ncbi:MAG: DEAD/DEAH box helicase [Gammaproteobacteria bacterium]|nr:DEAD/DEAH box helicase [Gammaproteobacteria bacterium]
MPFARLGLKAELLRTVTAQNYVTPTPIQSQAIPAVLAGRDVLAGAQTGTGKTAAFALPVLQRLAADAAAGARRGRAPRALVLTPTRELAAQVGDSFVTYGAELALSCGVIFGGVGIEPQKALLRRGVDILVATPGRLLDHADQRTVDLSAVEILVLDEADRMLDMGFIRDIRKVLRLLPRQRQNLLFSATYSDDIRRLAEDLLVDPAEIEVARRSSAAETVTQHVYRVEKEAKRDLLVHLIDEGNWYQVLVFTRTKHGANRLSEQLQRAGIEAAAIHGNKSQSARTRALAGFKDGALRVLVATDIAARGLDIDRLPHVVNYELPNVPEDYVHRIGRTGRAGESGSALSLVGRDEAGLLKDIERLLKRKVPELPMPAVVRHAPAPAATTEPAAPGGSRHRAAPRPAQGEAPAQPRKRRRSRGRGRRAAGGAT